MRRLGNRPELASGTGAIALGLLVLVLGACGDDGGASPPPETTGPTPSVTAPPVDPGQPTTSAPDAEVPQVPELDEAIDSYLRCIDIDCAEALLAITAAGPAATPRLLEQLEAGPPPDASPLTEAAHDIRLVAALGAIGDAAAVPRLLAMTDADDPVLRAEVANALAAIGGEDARDAIVRGLADPDPLVRESAAAGLARLGDAAALPPLRAAAAREELAHVAEAIDAAIASLEGG